MKLNQIQQQILINRKILAGLHQYEYICKATKKLADAVGETETEYKMHDALKEVKAQIARILPLQKALKQLKRDITEIVRSVVSYQKTQLAEQEAISE